MTELPEGIKGKTDLDSKPHIVAINPKLVLEIGKAFRYGASKHGLNTFRKMNPQASQYLVDAALRHLYSYLNGEINAEDSGVHHLAHAAANISMLYEIISKYGDMSVLNNITTGN